jgi:hypothetical protein
VVLNEEGGSAGDSFFEQWVKECMAERGRPKYPDIILRGCDPSKLDALLTQFTSTDIEFKTKYACYVLYFVIKHTIGIDCSTGKYNTFFVLPLYSYSYEELVLVTPTLYCFNVSEIHNIE